MLLQWQSESATFLNCGHVLSLNRTVGSKVGTPQQYLLPKLYHPKDVEGKWQAYWQKPEVYAAAYRFDKQGSTRPVYSIDTPPPFTNGEVHMGHAYWVVINDTVARYKRMRGYNVLLPQGWDCQGLPTELKVQNLWRVPRDDRELFRRKCVEWTEQMIKSMKSSMIKLGYRPDWEQLEYRTMDPGYWRRVQETLLTLYEQGTIYRGQFPVHWCPSCETALAQAEVGYIDAKGALYYFSFTYPKGSLEVATTRPELLGACQALAVNPADSRYSGAVGLRARLPLYDREVPVISDPQVDIQFGTGVVMVCTFGDEQDIKWQQKYGLPITRLLDEKGHLVNSGKYDGLNVKAARKAIVADLAATGSLTKQEEMVHKVLVHIERSDCQAPVEFLVKTQFFIKSMLYKEDVIAACREMKWLPEYMLQRLIDWVNSISWDWLISRQRIYGTPVPFWYCDDCNTMIPPKRGDLPVIPENVNPPVDHCPKCNSKNIRPSLDVCDCWVDSSITPLVNSGFFEDKIRHAHDYPISMRQQGHDIIRTWLFYTTLRCLLLTGKTPFRDALINGHILGPDGTKMSKSKGNVVSPEKGLEEFGADSMRQVLLSFTLGSDFPFKWESVRYCKGFLQKYWSSSRFAAPFLQGYTPSPDDVRILKTLDLWILTRLAETVQAVTKNMDAYQFHLAIEALQSFFWHSFCDQYLEAVKHRLYSPKDALDTQAVKYTLYAVLFYSTLLLSPFSPHITEEVYHTVLPASLLTVHASKWPDISAIPVNEDAKKKGDILIEVISLVRNEKSKKGIALSAELENVTVAGELETLDTAREAEEQIRSILRIKKLAFQPAESLSVRIP